MSDDRTLDVLTEIWKRKLKLPAIGTEQNFFEIGGNCELAVEVFREIAEILGQELPPVMIFQAPTIIALTSLLANPAAQRRCPAALLMNTSSENPPIFFAHGLGRDAMQVFPIIQHMEVSNPIYAIQARGIDGCEPALDSIENMADFYLQAIRNIQTHGPYFLIGYSFGGLVMLEVARRLSSQGQKIGFLAMLDSYPHRAHLEPLQQTLLLIRTATHRVRSLHSAFRASNNETPRAETENHSRSNPAQQRIYQGELRALRNYQPSFYSGKVNFVQAEIPSRFPRNPRQVWGKLVAEFELETAPGNHLTMMSDHYKTMAALLTRHLTRALAENSARSSA